MSKVVITLWAHKAHTNLPEQMENTCQAMCELDCYRNVTQGNSFYTKKRSSTK